MSRASMNSTRVRVRTGYGDVEGVRENGLAVFRNVPFAAPPFGARRFRPPQPPEKWQGVRDASVSGPAPPQPVMDGGDPVDTTWFNVSNTGEDCLTLEIWTPDPGANALPVMVWIYGGGYMIGSASSGAYSGRHFARDGVVHVGINYRVGVDGFVYFGEEGSDNLGLRDQVAGLEWVQRNIAAFGGDPSNVTVFGQSAGGVSVLNLLAMPSAKGLFVRAIAQSGSPVGSVPPDEAMKVTRRLARRLGVAPTRAGFETTTVAQTVAQTMPFAYDFANAFKHGAQSFMISPFRAVHGTPSLPEPPMAAAATTSIPLITGCTRNETITFLKLLGRTDGINPFIGWFFKRLLGVRPAMTTAYREGPRRITNPLAIVEAAWTDWAFRMPTLRLVETRVEAAPAVPTWVYEFRWESPGFPAGLGSFHALEVPFVRDELDELRTVPGSAAWIGAAQPAALAAFMHDAWVRFARTGDPGWPAYDLEHRQTMVFDDASAVVPDAAAPERQAWKGHR